jgi:hypothetical protein
VPACARSRLADVLESVANAHISLASDAKIDEAQRRTHLAQALVHKQASAEVVAAHVAEVARKAGNAALAAAVEAEVAAGALRHAYPPGVTTSVVSGSASAAASSGAASAGAAGSAAASVEPEIRVFRTAYAIHAALPSPAHGNAATEAAAAASSSAVASVDGGGAGKPSELADECEILDLLLTRMNDIQMDLGVPIKQIMLQLGGEGEDGSGGVTTIGFGAPSSSAAGGSAGAASSSAAFPAITHASSSAGAAGGSSGIVETIGFGGGGSAGAAGGAGANTLMARRRVVPAAAAGAAAAGEEAGAGVGEKRKLADVGGEQAGEGAEGGKAARTE